MKKLLSIIFIFLGIGLNAQSFNVQVSTDSVLFGNYIEVQFTIENLEGEFEAPDFRNFLVLSGPNFSTSMQFFNGKMSSKKSYSYFLEPREQGLIFIKPAYLVSIDKTFETSPIEINVYPNPEGIKISSRMKNESFEFNFQKKLDEFHDVPPQKEIPKTKKRKLKKI